MQSPFRSFWMAGYECTDQLNKHGHRVDLLSATGHLQQLRTDYELLSDFGIKTVREGIRWSVVEPVPYQYDWSSVAAMMHAGIRMGVQQIWDICHFGFPSDLTPLHPHFCQRFVALCEQFVLLFRSIDPVSPIIVTPVNEVSFLSWLGGEVAGTSPFCVRQGWEVKYHLMRAFIKAVAAMKAMDNNLIILTTEPLIHIACTEESTGETKAAAAEKAAEQFQAMDMLCGRMCPELGGRAEYLDIIGLNFYFTNQWEYSTCTPLPWAPHDRHPAWEPLSGLIENVYQRYNRPIVITETSHPGKDRDLWISYIGEECRIVVEKRLPLLGICIYPVIDRPDWDDPEIWHHSGLWDTPDVPGGPTGRVLYLPFAEALTNEQIYMNELLYPGIHIPATAPTAIETNRLTKIDGMPFIVIQNTYEN